MSDNTSPTSAQSTAAGKWVPRWRKNPDAVPSVRMYTELQIKQEILGESHSHTFTRALALATADASKISADSETDAAVFVRTELPLSEEFCRIMVHDKAHVNPPNELWTRNNLEQLDHNIGKPVPLFMETASKARMFEFLGWYRIKAWVRCVGGGKDVFNFIQKRQVSQTARSREYWEKALREDWARVELERINDPALKNPMEKAA